MKKGILLVQKNFDLSPFEADGAFRADFMFFLLRLNSFFESVFWDGFFYTKESRKKLRIHVETFNENLLEHGYKAMDSYIFKTLSYSGLLKNRPHLDCYNADFRKFLESFPDPVKEYHVSILRQEFGIFLTHEEFITTIEIFSTKRNDLEHWQETQRFWPHKKKKVSDREVIEALGLYILPSMRGMFLGSLHAAARRLKQEKQMEPVIGETGLLFTKAGQRAKENIQKICADERTRKNIDKARRITLAGKDGEYQRKIWAMCEKQGYRLGTFKNHYHFMGGRALHAIGAEIDRTGNDRINAAQARRRITSEKTPDFKYDYEALYLLGTRINCVLHRYITEVTDRDLQVALGKCLSQDKWGNFKKGQKAETYKVIKEKYPDLIAIRDTIAHNGLFWCVKKDDGAFYRVQDIFAAVFAHAEAGDSVNAANNFYTEILGLCKKHSRALAIPSAANTDKSAVETVRSWSLKRRIKYGNAGNYEIDKRPFLQNVVAEWVTALNEAYSAARKTRKRRKKA